MNNVDPDVMQDFLIWLADHEYEIANDDDDMGRLREIFYQLNGRNAGDSLADEIGF